MLTDLRKKYWVIHGNGVVRCYISKYVKSRRLRKPVLEQKIADLQPDCCSIAPPFTYTDLDLFGSFVVNQDCKAVKRYGMLYNYLVSRAVQIEMVSSVEIDSFINGLIRFIAHRRPISHLRGDNRTNYVGEFRQAWSEMNNDQVNDLLMKHSTQCVLNPATASHIRGIWELQIRTAREVLTSLLHELGIS